MTNHERREKKQPKAAKRRLFTEKLRQLGLTQQVEQPSAEKLQFTDATLREIVQKWNSDGARLEQLYGVSTSIAKQWGESLQQGQVPSVDVYGENFPQLRDDEKKKNEVYRSLPVEEKISLFESHVRKQIVDFISRKRRT